MDIFNLPITRRLSLSSFNEHIQGLSSRIGMELLNTTFYLFGLWSILRLRSFFEFGDNYDFWFYWFLWMVKTYYTDEDIFYTDEDIFYTDEDIFYPDWRLWWHIYFIANEHRRLFWWRHILKWWRHILIWWRHLLNLWRYNILGWNPFKTDIGWIPWKKTLCLGWIPSKKTF